MKRVLRNFTAKSMRRQSIILGFIGLFAIIGVLTVTLSSAATSVVSSEAESGTLSSNAKAVSSSLASGGSAVQFSAATPTPPTPPTPGSYPARYPQNCGVDGEVSSDVNIAQPIAGYPNVCTTGWIHTGVTLTPVSGDITVTQNGTVIDGKDVNGDILIKANNVKITRSWVRNRIFQDVRDNYTGLVVEDTEIGPLNHNARVSGDVGHGGIGVHNYTCNRCYVHTHSDLSWINGDVHINDSLLINPYVFLGTPPNYTDNDHADGAQASGGSGDVSISHTYMDIRAVNNSDKGGAGVIWGDGATGTATFTDNIFAGGQWTLSLHERGRFILNGNKIINNSWGGGAFYDTNALSVTCSGNTYITATGTKAGDWGC